MDKKYIYRAFSEYNKLESELMYFDQVYVSSIFPDEDED